MEINYPTSYSITLYDAIKYDATLLDGFNFTNPAYTEEFKNHFINRFGIYEIGVETIELFKVYITNRFNLNKEYFEKLLDKYYEELNETDGYYHFEEHTISKNGSGNSTANSNLQNIDLPNKVTNKEYVTSKNNSNNTDNYTTNDNETFNETRKGGVNVIDQRERILKYIRNIFLELVEKFKDCFCLLY